MSDEEWYSEDIDRRLTKGAGCHTEWIPGWAPLIEELNVALADIAPRYVIDQIKEKFGTLRYYITILTVDNYLKDELTDRVWAIVDEYEKRSASICMVCGEPGSLRGGSWVRTLCDEHSG